MGLISPNELRADPKKWLDIPHELHESLGSLMQKMYEGEGGFDLTDIHCLKCEGYENLAVITPDGPGIVTGYCYDENGEPLLRIAEPETEEVEA